MKTVLVFFDHSSNFKDEIELVMDCWKVFSDKNKGIKEKYKFTFIDDVFSLVREVAFYDYAMIDFGGLGYGSREAFAMNLECKIEDNPNTEFIILCTMGIEYYKGYFEKEYPNLKYFDRDYNFIFENLFKGDL